MVTLTSLVSFMALHSTNLCAQSHQLKCFSAETHHTLSHTLEESTVSIQQRAKSWLQRNPRYPYQIILWSSLSKTTSIQILPGLFLKKPKYFNSQSGTENVNCELLRGLAKEKLPGILEREMCKHTAEETLHRSRVKLAGAQTLHEELKSKQTLGSSELMY